MLQHPYSFIQSARAHTKSVLKYCLQYPQLTDITVQEDFDRLGKLHFPPKDSPLEDYQDLVIQYVSLLERVATVLARIQVEVKLANKPAGHLDKRMKEINKDVGYHLAN